jgi:tRNA dimethylallyltransferase
MRAVGYRQIWAFLDGRLKWDEAAGRAVAATRQLAKRQLTWLRGDPRTEKLDAADSRLREQLCLRLGRMADSA